MSATPDEHRQAADPATPAQTLADLAAAHPELQPVIAANPGAYAGLLDWLRQYGGPEVHAALAARTAVRPAPPPPAPGAPFAPRGPWREPSRTIPLTWGSHDLRYALALVAVGVAALLHVVVVPFVYGLIVEALYADSWAISDFDYGSANITSLVSGGLVSVLPWLLLGAAVALLPARRKNRIAALVLVGSFVLYRLLMMLFGIALETGGGSYWLYGLVGLLGLLSPTLAIAAWLVARMRPGAAFALLPITILDVVGAWFLDRGFLFYSESALHPLRVAFGVLGIGILVGIAWLARVIAKHKALAPTPEERAAAFAAQQHAARVAYVQQWEAAYAAAHGGQAPPPGTMPPPPGF